VVDVLDEDRGWKLRCLLFAGTNAAASEEDANESVVKAEMRAAEVNFMIVSDCVDRWISIGRINRMSNIK
jgi:hypothetical protein